jgi:hypothetical protein
MPDIGKAIDTVISKWAQRRRATISAIYKENESRCIDFHDEANQRYQIWVDPPINDPLNSNPEIGVHAWDYGKRRKDFVSQMNDLPRRLDEAYGIIQKWMTRGKM